jgi:hypothetical protein
MTYPERGATYKHKPKFIERMKRAEGGPTNLPNPATAKVRGPIGPTTEALDLLDRHGASKVNPSKAGSGNTSEALDFLNK